MPRRSGIGESNMRSKATLAAVLATTLLGVSAASAQPPSERREDRRERREDRAERREDRRERAEDMMEQREDLRRRMLEAREDRDERIEEAAERREDRQEARRPDRDERVDEAREDRDERVEEAAERREDRREARIRLANWNERRRMREARRDRHEEWERAREDLRREQWERIRVATPTRVIVTPTEPRRTVVYVPDPVRAELTLHAHRMAELERIHDLSKNHPTRLARVDSLIRRELARHTAVMRSFGIQVVI
jgi:hypothetical protein